MLVLVTVLAAASLQMVDEPLPGVQIGAVTPFTGLPTTNYLQQDVNGDQLPDLVLPGAIYLQESSRFPESERHPWPESAHGNEADLFQGSLFVRTPSSLRIYEWASGAWNERHAQPLPWTGVTATGSVGPPTGTVATFRRFTYDIDGDGAPELLDLDSTGVHIFRLEEGAYVAAGTLNVLPAVTLAPPSTLSIWPPESRRIVLPTQEMACRLLVVPGALSIITHEKRGADRLLFTRETYPLHTETDGQFSAGEPVVARAIPVPSHVRPCTLNGDETMDFAGGRWVLSTSTPLPMPIYETWASLDNGQTFQIERTPSFQHFRPQCSFLDFDSDGDLDMVTESTGVFDGGAREAMNRYLAESTLPHRVAVHRQNENGFDQQPTIQFKVGLGLDAPPVAGGAMLERYQRGALVNLTGDFNGDGFRDLAIRDSADQVKIYLAQGWRGWNSTPARVIGIPEGAEVAAADLNGDGRSDLLLRWTEGSGGTAKEYSIAYYAEHLER